MGPRRYSPKVNVSKSEFRPELLDHVHSIRPPAQAHNKELWAPKRNKGCCAVDVNTSQLCSERLSLAKGGDGLLGTSQSTFLVVNFTKKEN